MLSTILSSLTPLTLSVEKLTFAHDLAPEDLFSLFANQPWAMWLDSGKSDHIDACFDVLVWQPEVTLSTVGEETTIHHKKSNKTFLSNDDPFIIIECIQQQVLAPLSPSQQGLPFLGGALGYFAYDLGRRFEKLPVKAKQDINLADMAVGIYSQAVLFDHKNQQYYLVCSPEQRQTIELILQKLIEVNGKSKHSTEVFSLTSPWQSNMDKACYIDKFNQVQAYLLSGDCYQINLAQRFSAKYQGDEFQAYCALRSKNKAPFSAFMRLDNSAILSLSPERFLQCHQGMVQSKPIKGTMPRNANTTQDKENAKILANSTKDRAENLMIVDLLRNDISKVCEPNSVTVPKLFDIESFSAVHHLVSTVEGKLAAKYKASDLLRGAFPGGSITGAPKIRAMEIIEQLEPHRRSVYCGSIGYLSSCGTMDTSITIRTLICEKAIESGLAKTVYCWAGGGLVADSLASNEYQETFDKVNHILPVLAELGKKRHNGHE